MRFGDRKVIARERSDVSTNGVPRVHDGFLPSRPMCTDNAAMVAAAAWWRLLLSGPSPLELGAEPNLRFA